jgi:hypothetical protein
LVVEDGTSHTLSFIDRTNRGVIAPEGSTLESPVAWEWSFVQCSTGCVTPSSANSSIQNPSDITFTFPSMVETVYVKLKVSGNNSTVSEVVKPVQLTKFESDDDLKLTLINVINPESHYYMSDASTLKAVNWINIEFRGDMTANRVTGGYVTISVVGNAGSGSLSGTNFSATNIGTASITSNQALPNNGRSVGIGWSNPANTTLTVTATYYSSAAVVLATTQKTISFTNSTSLEPCKPCDPTQVPIATVPEEPISAGPGRGGGTGGGGSGVVYVRPIFVGYASSAAQAAGTGGVYIGTTISRVIGSTDPAVIGDTIIVDHPDGTTTSETISR